MGSTPTLRTPHDPIELEIEMSYAEERAALDKDLALYRVMRDRVDRIGKGLRQREDEMIDRRLAELTDDQIMADPELRTWLCRVHGNHTGAYRRVKVLTKVEVPGVIEAGGSIDGREKYIGANLPVLTVALERNTPIGPLTRALITWFQVWALGRESIRLGVLESTLSAGGSYQVEYTPGATPEARLLRNGRALYIPVEGPLPTVLAYVATCHPYNHGRETDEEDY